jgi:hypothetical protein
VETARTKFCLAAVLLTIAVRAPWTNAAVVFVANTSFEVPAVQDNASTSAATGWDVGNTLNPASTSYVGAGGNGTPSGADGAQVAFMSGGLGTLIQILRGPDGTFGTADDPRVTANTQYTFTLAIGARLDAPFSGYSFELDAYEAGVYTPLGIQTNTIVPPAGHFVDTTLVMDTTAFPNLVGKNLAIRLKNTVIETSQTNYDNVRLTATSLTGDFSFNNTVDAGDYIVWRKNNGTQSDYDLWRSHFGLSTGISAGSVAIGRALSGSSPVPEPATVLTLSLALLVMRFGNARSIFSNRAAR